MRLILLAGALESSPGTVQNPFHTRSSKHTSLRSDTLYIKCAPVHERPSCGENLKLNAGVCVATRRLGKSVPSNSIQVGNLLLLES